MIIKKKNALEGRRINFVMEFNAVNGFFALALVRLGARIKWASNDRCPYYYNQPGYAIDDISIAQAVAV